MSKANRLSILVGLVLPVMANAKGIEGFITSVHGVAQPRGEYLLASVRRDDAQTTSSNPILPDNVDVFHLHDGEFEQEQVLADTCPDLHGAAQNHDVVVFGCSDGVLVAYEEGNEFGSSKIANIDALSGLRIGSIYGHHEVDALMGVAAGSDERASVLVAIHADEAEMEVINWAGDTDASAISYAFSHDGEHFLILDSEGYLNVLTAHVHGDHSHWEVEERLDITDEDVSLMPDGSSFSMTVSQSSDHVYVADPIAQHVLQIDLESLSIINDIELGYSPAAISWLGVAHHEH